MGLRARIQRRLGDLRSGGVARSGDHRYLHIAVTIAAPAGLPGRTERLDG